ncbi:MAG: hypothetical protein RRA92_10860 [Gemmatimonadota bacterium]|nr:hypothetical protein [Gemmatimonadota bacterium]
MKTSAATLTALLVLAGCVPKKVNERPIMENDQVVPDASATVATASADAERRRAASAAERDAIRAEALSSCEPAVCDAVLRGEVALGMNEVQVLAATGTTEAAWAIRRSGPAAAMAPADAAAAPTDAVGNLALVQLADGHVSRYGYSEAQGIRLVSAPYDATTEGRAAALADQLLREGDELAARGDFDAALNRYDRASILAPGDPLVDYRIATALDKALRPIEALVQYRLFLHRLEIEKIEARGEAAARLAEAIAQARQRVLILERQGG